MTVTLCPLKYSDETLAVFKSFKLDDMQASKRKLEELRTSGGEHVYFAKFLTSEKVRKAFSPIIIAAKPIYFFTIETV